MERPIVREVLCSLFSEAIVTVKSLPDRPGVAASVFEALAEQEIDVDMITQNVSLAGFADITFSVSREDGERARDVVAKAIEVSERQSASLISIGTQVIVRGVLGTEMPARIFRILGEYGCNMEIISTSLVEIKCVVVGGDIKKAIQELQKLTEEFGVKRQIVDALRAIDLD